MNLSHSIFLIAKPAFLHWLVVSWYGFPMPTTHYRHTIRSVVRIVYQRSPHIIDAMRVEWQLSSEI